MAELKVTSLTRRLIDMYNPRRRVYLCKDDKSEHEIAQEALAKMKQIEASKSQDMHTIILSNGTRISSTSFERLNEYESKYARMGVKVKKRY